MFVSSFISLGFAIALSQVGAKIPNQILQLPTEVLIVITLLITTQQIYTLNDNN